jgi:hypothetical protein
LAMDQILWGQALADGVPLFGICDNDSQGLHEAYVILTDKKGTRGSDRGTPEGKTETRRRCGL